jgi:2,4-dienoyl-CoA reductase (NADPH2)
LGVRVELNRRVSADHLRDYEHVIVATGIVPRIPPIPGIDHPKVANYVEIVDGRRQAGRRVAIIGAGGIGFDVGEFLTAGDAPPDGHKSVGRDDDPAGRRLSRRMGHRPDLRAAWRPQGPADHASPRRLWLLQRKGPESRRRPRQDHRLDTPCIAQEARVVMLSGVQYNRIDSRWSFHHGRTVIPSCSTSIPS